MTTTSHTDTQQGANAFNIGVGNGGNGLTNSVNKNLNINNGSSSSILNNGSSGVVVIGNSHHATETIKQRKKLKSRNVSMPHSGYGKDHLDAWLDTCLKDASNAQLSSSSEFLDYNPTTTSTTITTNAKTNKSFFVPQQQQQQQQQQQLSGQQQPPVQFAMRTAVISGNHSSASPFSQGFQRSMPNFMKHTQQPNSRYSMLYPSVGNGSFYTQNDGAQDFASLPPIVNMFGGGYSEHGNNSTDVLDGSGSNPNISRGFRFSDPCLLNPSDNDSKISGQQTPPTSDRRNQSATEMEPNKLFSALMEQINLLHEANTKIYRNLHETKVDIEALKHAPPTWGMRHRRDSLSGLSSHSQPLIFGGGGFGAQSPAPTFHSGAYTPGLMTDVVREVKDAARVREDALLNRVKSMVEERQWSTNDTQLRLMREIEDLKSQVHHLRTDRKETNKRLTHLESEHKYMRQMLGSILNNRHLTQPDIIYENETLQTRRQRHQQQHQRRMQSLNQQFGTKQHESAMVTVPTCDESTKRLSVEESLHINETHSNDSTITAAAVPQVDAQQSSFSSSEGSAAGGFPAVATKPIFNGNITNVCDIASPPKFALVSTSNDDNQRENSPKVYRDEVEMVQQKIMLRELNEAVAARRQADERIIALEKLVKNHQIAPANAPNGGSGGGGFTNTFTPSTSSLSSVFIATPAPTPSHTIAWQPTASIAASYAFNSRQKQHQAGPTAVSSTNAPKLSVADPITDL